MSGAEIFGSMQLKHPYHPPHPLVPRLIDYMRASDICNCCGEESKAGWIYHCPDCEFTMHMGCTSEPWVLEVCEPKSHEHKLVLLPKPRHFTCDACGLALDSYCLPWACLQCGVMIHKNCINLPRAIRISRHEHRLCYVSSTHEALPCGVCRKAIDKNCGAYSCIKGCHYAVHSKCATRKDVWDGQDLYGEPEEDEDVEEPFEVVDSNAIHHFSHAHHLSLNEDDGGSKHCQICALPVRLHFGNLYICKQRDCDFVLHESCANLPRKIWCMLHPHRLKLQSCGSVGKICHICCQDCCGFMYKCCKEDCGFNIDVNCASISEPFVHTSHPHPLFSTSNSSDGQTCSDCKRVGDFYRKMMQCIECDFVLCLRCIILPPKVRYKHDRHPLVLRGGDDAKGGYQCSIRARYARREWMRRQCSIRARTVAVSPSISIVSWEFTRS